LNHQFKVPSVSIGMPVFNCEKYISNSINSILNQTFKDWELILINDNSSDSTLKIIKLFNDPRIRVINNIETLGLAACLNFCIDNARGIFFARMDGDDVMFNSRLEIQYKHLIENENIDIVGTNAIIIDQDDNIIGSRISKVSKDINQLFNNGGLFIHPSILGRTEWFKKNQYNQKFLRCQDLELWARTIDNSNFEILNSFQIFYRDVVDIKFKKYLIAGYYVRKIIIRNKNKISKVNFYKYYILTYLKSFYFFIHLILGSRNNYNYKNLEAYKNEFKKSIQ